MALQLVLKHKVLLTIVILALFLRLFEIDKNPKAMYGDELTLVYDAYSILKTGKDQNGQFLPTYFSMGGGRPAGYIYATIPFVAIFGPTPLAGRITSVLSGVGIVILLYLICSQLLSRKIGFYAASLGAITPWELSLSRGAFETHFALFLALLAVYFFYKAKSKKRWYLVSGLSFALSMQTYSTYVVIIPLFVMALLLQNGLFKIQNFFSNWKFLIFVIIITASLAFSIFTSINRGSKDRFTNLYIFNQPDLQNKISGKVKAERAFSPLKPELAIGMHNRVLENMPVLLGNYARTFSLEFLFLEGDKNPRHNPASMGQLYFFMLPLLIFGTFYLSQQAKNVLILLGLWTAIAPVATSLVGDPHALRNSFLLPPLIILAASGFEKIRKSKQLKIILLIIFIIQLPFFINRFYYLSPHLYSSFWSYSAKRAAVVALQNRQSFDHIILSTSIADMEFAYPVYTKVEPKEFMAAKNQETYLGEFTFLKFANVYLGSIPKGRIREIMSSLKGSVLYLGPIENQGVLQNEKIEKDKDGSPLFVISTTGDAVADLR